MSGGENIYTSEVEAALYQHAGIQECAVVGVPDEKYGEVLFAVIVPAAEGNTLTETDVIDHCRERIGGYKIPRQMDFSIENAQKCYGQNTGKRTAQHLRKQLKINGQKVLLLYSPVLTPFLPGTECHTS